VRILIAPDKFKGSLSAADVADSLAEGLARVDVDSASLPLADGGDGSVAAALASGLQPRVRDVSGPTGRRRPAAIAVNGSTAVFEIANTCGLAALTPGDLAPMTASSYGFGEAIRHAVDVGARRLVLALGGSASTDGGTGMLAALGYRFHDINGDDVVATTTNLHRIHTVHSGDAVDLRGFELIVASDVTSPLTGPGGAAAVFGPQKGATLADIDYLEAGLLNLVAAMQRSGWADGQLLAASPGAGAAGGCGFAATILGARIASGADYFLDLLDFQNHCKEADLVITGEGRLDQQTLAGKLPAAVARRAAPTSVIAVGGRNDLQSQTTPFIETYAVADYSDTDTAHDNRRTARLLELIGARIGQRFSPQPAVS
jgi:glycerate 2-kinase